MSAVSMNRVTQGVTFDKGIHDAQWTERPVGQTVGGTQHSLLPGETTVSQALENVFPKDPTVSGLVMKALAQAGSAMLLRTQNGYRGAATKTVRALRTAKGRAAGAAADEIEALLEDSDLLDRYRAALLES